MNIILTILCVLIFSGQVLANVKVYFNYNQENSYVDPYRGILRPGDNLEQIIIDNINSAKKSIWVAVQELRLPLVAKALVDKKAQGIDIKVILERDYHFSVLGQRDVSSSSGEYETTKLNELKALVDVDRDGKFSESELQARDAIYILKKANISLIDDSFDESAGSGLMHHKFIVIDGKKTIVSSANFTLSCIHGDITNLDSRGNANSMVVVKSTEFAGVFAEEFKQLWGNGKRGNFGHNKTYRGAQTVVVGESKMTIQFSPTSAKFNWEESVNGLAASYLKMAKKSIKAALFVYSDQKLGDVLKERNSKGAKVGVLVESKFAFRDYSELLDMLGIEMLSDKCTIESRNRPWSAPAVEAGVAKLNYGDVLHHKFAVIDNSVVIVGSQNWSDAANFVNDETLIVIESNSIADKYTQEYNRLLSTSKLGIPETLLEKIEAKERDCISQVY